MRYVQYIKYVLYSILHKLCTVNSFRYVHVQCTNPRPGSGPLCYWTPRQRMYNCTVHQIVMYSKLNKIYTVYYIRYAQ